MRVRAYGMERRHNMLYPRIRSVTVTGNLMEP